MWFWLLRMLNSLSRAMLGSRFPCYLTYSLLIFVMESTSRESVEYGNQLNEISKMDLYGHGNRGQVNDAGH